jgi:hypothetical protein
MENDKLQKSSGLLFSNDLISRLFVALVVFILGLIAIIIEKEDKSYILVIQLITIALLAFIILANFIINLISEWINGGKDGCKHIWMRVLPILAYEHHLSIPDYLDRSFRMEPFEGEIKLKKAYLFWKPNGKTTLVWQFPTDHCFTEDEKESIVSDITNSQALYACLNPKNEFHKKELIQNRIYAYKYEDLIFELFSKRGIHYSERQGWLVDKKIPYDAFKSALEKRFSLDSEEAVSVIAELHAKEIIVDLSLGDRKENVYIGDILTKYWYIVSMEDMNFNKYCKMHESSIVPSEDRR